ncbi:hypothetical protein VYH28_000102 [Vibrio alginolyticus]|nr:hypothetical protein [Vibrio alginolyticus]EME3934702.1 hypothetical protein [Vibrio alginolyticus]
MTQAKSVINKKHYEKHKTVLKEKARTRRAEAKKQKTFSELMEQLSTATQKAKAKFLMEHTPAEYLKDDELRPQLANAFNLFIEQQNLNESETLQIRKNKRLVQRWQMFLKALEQHMNQTIDKRVK